MIAQFKKLWQHRILLWYLVKVEFKISYKNKILGYLWSLLDPLMLMAVYVVLVQVIFKRGEPKYPVLLFSALLAWRFFLSSVQGASGCITSKSKLLQTVAFPTILLPTQVVLSNALQYFLSLGALFPMLVLLKANFTFNILWFIPTFIIHFFLTYGSALLVSVIGVYFRDIQNILQFGLRMVWYLSPGLFSVPQRIPERIQGIYMVINPFAPLLETYKNIFVRGKPPVPYFGVTAIIAILILVMGVVIFSRKEKDLPKEV